MVKYAIIKNGEILYITDNIPKQQVYFSENEYQKIIDTDQEKIDTMKNDEFFNYQYPSNVKVGGIDYDEAIPFEFEGKIIYENGQIIEDKSEMISIKKDIKKRIGDLVSQKNGIIELGEDTAEINSQIEALKQEYISITN